LQKMRFQSLYTMGMPCASQWHFAPGAAIVMRILMYNPNLPLSAAKASKSPLEYFALNGKILTKVFSVMTSFCDNP